MELRFVAPELRRLDETRAEVLACSVFADHRPLRGLSGLVDWRLAGRLSALARQTFLVGDAEEVLCVPVRPRLPFDKVLVLGMGVSTSFDDATYRRVVTRLLRALEGLKVRKAVVELPGRGTGAIEPTRAVELLLECVGDSTAHDAWWLVEPLDAQRAVGAAKGEERRYAPA